MPRVRADDYDDKKNKILDTAATLFAERGYSGSRMDEIAEFCGVSKSMLYHYFKKKEDVLFQILQEHLTRLIEAIESNIADGDRADKFKYFRGIVEAYLSSSDDARARHVVAMHDMRYLTEDQQKRQIDLERKVLKLIEQSLEHLVENKSSADYRVSAFLLVGMLNWVELWYRRSGRISPSELYDRVTHLFLSGFLKDGGALPQDLTAAFG